jgi:uncharacterized protein (TIGR02145 family)
MKGIKIGQQTWATENLDTTVFRNGDPIRLVKSIKEWKDAMNRKEPACCYFEFNAKKYGAGGLLYNWYAVADARGLAPDGWEIPTDKEWATLVDGCGKKKLAGYALKGKTGWAAEWGSSGSNKNAGDNSTGFNALPSGYLMVSLDDLEFMNHGWLTYFWTSTLKKGSTEEAYSWGLNTGKSVERSTNAFATEMNGMSVRCIQR